MNFKICICVSLFLLQNSISVQAQCWTWDDVDDPQASTTCKPLSSTTQTPTSTSSPVPTSTLPGFRRCLKRCPTTTEYDPVCGTNGITYNNENMLICAKQCGLSVDKLGAGPCENRPPTPSTRSPPFRPDPLCLRSCPTTSEYSPVCGTDGVTYDNENKMRCARRCGANVQIQYNGNCAGRPVITTSTQRPIYPRPPNYDSCVRTCVVKYGAKPVCGSNGVTYENESHLQCDVSCGISVQKMRDGSC